MALFHWPPSTRQRGLASGTFALTAGRIVCFPFYVHDFKLRITQLVISVDTEALFALGGAAIYTYHPRTHQPWRRVVAGATQYNLGISGLRSIVAKTILPVARYYLCFGANNSNVVLDSFDKAGLIAIPHTAAYSALGTHWKIDDALWVTGYVWPQDAAEWGAITLQSGNIGSLMLETDVLEGV